MAMSSIQGPIAAQTGQRGFGNPFSRYRRRRPMASSTRTGSAGIGTGFLGGGALQTVGGTGGISSRPGYAGGGPGFAPRPAPHASGGQQGGSSNPFSISAMAQPKGRRRMGLMGRLRGGRRGGFGAVSSPLGGRQTGFGNPFSRAR